MHTTSSVDNPIRIQYFEQNYKIFKNKIIIINYYYKWKIGEQLVKLTVVLQKWSELRIAIK